MMTLPLLIAALWMASASASASAQRPITRRITTRRRIPWPGPGAPPPAPPAPYGATPPGFRRVITRQTAPQTGPRGAPGGLRIPKVQIPKSATSWLSNLFGGGERRSATTTRPAAPSPAAQVQRPAPTQREAPRASPIPAQARVTTTRATPAPAGRSPQAAASDLLTYFNAGRPLGTKDAPSTFVEAAQRDMGGGIATDGIYGPDTRARGRALIGKVFPPRTSQPRAGGTPQGGRGVIAPSPETIQRGRGVAGLYIP